MVEAGPARAQRCVIDVFDTKMMTRVVDKDPFFHELDKLKMREVIHKVRQGDD
jgi:hypothetical protein